MLTENGSTKIATSTFQTTLNELEAQEKLVTELENLVGEMLNQFDLLDGKETCNPSQPNAIGVYRIPYLVTDNTDRLRLIRSTLSDFYDRHLKISN